MTSAKVYLVGAGPGDPGLLTLRALDVLRSADVVIYDRLVSRAVLAVVPRRVTLTFGGKRPGDGEPLQKRINELMLREAKKGKKVVRLKGGDPFLFSRGAEEVEFLKKHGIQLEVVPGVTSVTAVPAYAGIPLTHRRFSSSVTILTGHQVPSKEKKLIRWSKIVGGSDTLVVLMGVARLTQIARNLIQLGLAPSTPVAAIEWGTTAQQKTLLLTLSEAAAGNQAGFIRSPGLIVIGKVVSLADTLGWRASGEVRISTGYRSSLR